jgi:integrase/recombinase XerD
MLTIYRRHLKSCEHRKRGRRYRRCRCPIWVDGFLGRQEIRQSMRLRDWGRAQERVRQWEAEQTIKQESPEGPKTLNETCEAFLADAEVRNLQEGTLRKYRLLFRQLQGFAEGLGIRYLEGLDVNALRKFRASWKDRNLAALKKLERLRSFFKCALESGWIDTDPAKQLKRPEVSQRPTMAFTSEEISCILMACNEYHDSHGRTEQQNARRLRALVLLLRYSGLRIGDAVTLGHDRVTNSKLFLYTAKTGTPVWFPLPDFVVDALASIMRPGQSYFFWTGKSKLDSVTADWRRALSRLFSQAKVADGHAHRFRDTFATELLMAGTPLDRVSVLLGHQSVKVTERHYAPWVKGRQERLEADVKHAWPADPIVFAGTKGTHGVHAETKPVN